MRPVTRLPLLIAALALPIAVVLFSYAMTNGPRTPQVPAEVHVGDTSGPVPGTPAPAPTSTSPPADLPPPEPEDDDDEPDDLDHDD